MGFNGKNMVIFHVISPTTMEMSWIFFELIDMIAKLVENTPRTIEVMHVYATF